jgi:phosphoribosyl-dephospho-CoA transferase
MSDNPGVHALLRIDARRELAWDEDGRGVAPEWTWSALERLPYVVVRRDEPREDLLPVGVRGIFRSQRAPAWLPRNAILECITPPMLAERRGWRDVDMFRSPAIAVLSQVENILEAHGLAGCWGPGGSVGAELASGVACTTVSSDLDLLLFVGPWWDMTGATALHRELSALPVRVDALLETSHGGIALADFVGNGDKVLLRTAQGPRLMQAPLSSTPV